MPLPRLITLIVGLCLILGLMLWLVNSLYRLYIQIAFTTPLLANLLLLLLLVLLGLLIAAFVYYFNLTLQPRRRRSRRLTEPLPEQKALVASQNLAAVRQQVEQISDEVARQALLTRSREIEANLARGDVRVAVFGTGSAGKTSVINALIGRVVGEVGAPMGTTQMGETYRLRLLGLGREIWLTDTPGILEMGEAGSERAQIARQLAAEADLLLFVLDNDLRQSEYAPLSTLAEIGKRSLVVLNKRDLYNEADLELILARLRERLRSLIAPSDIVAVSARPQPYESEGHWLEPQPDVLPLVKHLAAVLRAEGEDLVADNILLQSQRLGEDARRFLDKQRRRQADKIVDRYQWVGAGAIAVMPLPVVDLLATAAVNAQMVVELGKVYGCELNLERGRELALSLAKTLVSLGAVKGALQLVTTALQLNVATYLVGKSVQGVTAAYLTRIAGKSFIEYFRHDQDWGDGGMTEVVQQQFKLVQKDEFIQAFVKDAIAKAIQPLRTTLLLDRDDLPPEEPLEFAPPISRPPPVEIEARLEDSWESPRRSHRDEDW